MAAKLIGLYSPVPQSGKSTVASYLASQHNFERHTFAGPLKRMAVELMNSAGLTSEQIGYYMEQGKEDPLPSPIGVSFRYLCQTLGRDWGRNLISDDLWTGITMAGASATDGNVVIEDVRFPNEYKRIVEAGGEVWRISRTGAMAPNDHPSEGLLEGFLFDAEITNDGTVEDLQSKVWWVAMDREGE